VQSAQPSHPAHVPASLLSKFRSDRKRLPLHPREKAVLTLVAVHLCFLPWALGTMRPWGQITSLCLATIGIVLALIPRNYTADQSGGPAMRLTMWPRLLRFPIFWIGLTLLAYIAVQGFNPSWVWTRNATTWWLVRVNDIPWLPTSVDTPFERFNVWRQFIIYTSSWLTVCTVWTGFTRRRSLQILVAILVGNALALALVGFLQEILHADTIVGLMKREDDLSPFSSFINKNHAGAYLSLTTVMTAALATWYFDQGERKMKKSTPAGILALASIFLAGTVLFTLSRGASIALGLCAVFFFGWLILRRKLQANRGGNPAVSRAVTVIFIVALVGTANYVDFSHVFKGFDRLIKQQTNEESVRARLYAYEASKTMLGDHWVRGVGAGGFRYLFPEYIKKYPRAYEGGQLFWEHAHNDWLEIPIDLGLVGTLLLVGGALWWMVWLTGHSAVWHSLAVPMLLGCSQTLFHAWFDFPLQCPAILATWCALVAISARWIEIESADGSTTRG